MLTSAGGILALLQDNPHVKEDSKTEDVQLKVRLKKVFNLSHYSE